MRIRRSVGLWLLICAMMVMAMATIGAVTRLTESGLSIVRWEPIKGAVPPTSEAAWQQEFDLYKTSPQYKYTNGDMELPDFKKIYFWEWLHRLWGRLIGLVFALPLVYFWWKSSSRSVIPAKAGIQKNLEANAALSSGSRVRRSPDGSLARDDKYLTPALKKHCLGILALGFVQGFVGWYMVKSGLVNRPEVSHYRLAMHLMIAVALYGWMWSLAISILQPQLNKQYARARKLYRHGAWTVGVLALTMTWGAFVAGLDAGLIYNTFPLMDGHVIPPEAWDMQPVLVNLVENHATVQWFHRCLAYLTAFMVLGYSIRAFVLPLPKIVKRLAAVLLFLVIAQIGLGAATVMSHVEIHPAVTHQFNAFLLLGCLLWNLVELRKSFRAPAVTE